MTSQAETIRNLLFDEWSLTGELSKVPLDNMKEIVYFFDRKQVEGNEQTKVITVEKIDATEDEDEIVHPNFTEKTDKYEITLYYRVIDVQQLTFSEALDNIEQMATETQRILRLAFDPTTTTGPFFTKSSRWEKSDMIDQAQPQLERKLSMVLSNVISANPEVFIGYGGILLFDTSDSAGDNLPVTDFEYTELLDVGISEGFAQIPYLTKDVLTNGRGVPYYQRGLYSGTFVAHINASKSDIEGTTADKLYNLIRTQSNTPLIGQNIQAVFLHTVNNTESPTPATFTTKSFLRIRIEKIGGDVELISYRLHGTLTKPSEAIIA